MLVPLPSLANIEPEENVTGADPTAFVLKLTVIILPAEPVNPGFKTIPSKFIVPSVLENVGSCTQSVIIEPLLEREIASNLSDGKEITPEAAFIAWSALETYTLTENADPTEYVPDDGEKYKLAACANAGRSR